MVLEGWKVRIRFRLRLELRLGNAKPQGWFSQLCFCEKLTLTKSIHIAQFGWEATHVATTFSTPTHKDRHTYTHIYIICSLYIKSNALNNLYFSILATYQFYIYTNIFQNTPAFKCFGTGMNTTCSLQKLDKINAKPEYDTHNVILVNTCKILAYLAFSLSLKFIFNSTIQNIFFMKLRWNKVYRDLIG